MGMNNGLVPSTPIVEKRTYASAMSYVGSARRISAWIKGFGSSPGKAVAAWILGIPAILLMWTVVTAWYFITVFLFGIFLIPFRLIRRGNRKQIHLQEQQLATMQTMMIQQQQSLQQRPHEGQILPQHQEDPALLQQASS
jgi:Flp pilus assembly protein TadB